MKKLVLIACAVTGLIIPAQAQFPTYRLGEPIQFRGHNITIDNVVTVGRSPREAGYRTIQVWLRSDWKSDPTGPDGYFVVELEDKQVNRWAPRSTQIDNGQFLIFFDIPENASDQGNLNLLLFTDSWEQIAKVAAHF